jgi:hypothetical protein
MIGRGLLADVSFAGKNRLYARLFGWIALLSNVYKETRKYMCESLPKRLIAKRRPRNNADLSCREHKGPGVHSVSGNLPRALRIISEAECEGSSIPGPNYAVF